MTIKKGELADVEIPPSTGVTFKKGRFNILNREKSKHSQFQLPSATAAIRGTDFLVEVHDNGDTEITVLDGEILLANNLGEVAVTSGQRGTALAGRAPSKTALLESANNLMQWSLYYPAILDVDESELTAERESALGKSLAAYRSGDLMAALASCPWDQPPKSDPEKIYRAALLLSVGQVEKAEALLGSEPTARSEVSALQKMIAAVKFQPWSQTGTPISGTDWMAESYYQQSLSHLPEALKAAEAAVARAPNFGFGWTRLAELQFSFGRTPEALKALENGLRISPRHAQALALKGFLLSAQNKIADAISLFDQAVALDSALGNAWLGRGLCLIRLSHIEEGTRDLFVAASLEPQRAVYRSYLGKALSVARDNQRATHELDLARQLDPNDPTSWLYSALLNQQENRINAGVADLEKSQQLNTNRSVFRSRLLLDQDRAVRSANLAAIYRDAGMTDLSVREASRAVSHDYANYSAHLFLANSYNELRDPKQINLRYETPWFAERLIANLLAPVGGGSLSQYISQEEYSKLFERDRLGISSSTEYQSTGDWLQTASQYGTFGNSSYALDATYRTQNGLRPNNDLSQLTYSAKFKQQITPQDSVYLEALFYDADFGDVAQYYSQSSASKTQRVTEKETPNIFIGYHHEWAPGIHSLLLLGRLDDALTRTDANVPLRVLTRNAAGEIASVTDYAAGGFVAPTALSYRRKLEAYTADLQQIWQQSSHNVIFGARYQTGWTDTTSELRRRAGSLPFALSGLTTLQQVSADLGRVSFYGYDYWRILDSLQFTAGLSYDRLTYPINTEIAPITDQQKTKDQVSPKVGLLWTPFKNTDVRGLYTRSLGGVFYDTSVRLEPTQIAGFNQAFRSIVPESVAGLIPGSEFESGGLAIDQKFNTGTYLSIAGEILNSDSERLFGVFDAAGLTATPSSTPERLKYRERTLTVTVNQLLGKYWATGASYRLSDADLRDRFSAIPTAASPLADRNLEGTRHQLNTYLLFNCDCGFFAKGESVWSGQSNRGYQSDLPGDDFWQVNFFAGYRFLQRRAEVTLGLLNATDQDYQLNPLNPYFELLRHRAFYARVKFSF